MWIQPYTEADDIKRVADLRRYLLTNGASPYSLRATPSDLKRFGLERWEGRFCGIVCDDSPIQVVKR